MRSILPTPGQSLEGSQCIFFLAVSSSTRFNETWSPVTWPYVKPSTPSKPCLFNELKSVGNEQQGGGYSYNYNHHKCYFRRGVSVWPLKASVWSSKNPSHPAHLFEMLGWEQGSSSLGLSLIGVTMHPFKKLTTDNNIKAMTSLMVKSMSDPDNKYNTNCLIQTQYV